MHILFITAEVAPLSGSRNAATVCAALPKALRGLGRKVTVLSPLYEGINPTAHGFARRLTKLECQIDGRGYSCELYDGRTPGGVNLLFIGHEELFRSTDTLDTDTAEEMDARRVGVFARAALEAIVASDEELTVLHCHDWVGAAVALLASNDDRITQPSVLTVHDVTRQGAFATQHAQLLGLSPDLLGPNGAGHAGRVNLLAGGLRRADRATTVSPTYAREVMRPESGHGLDTVLAELGERLEGIPNGVDVAVWNPATDAHLVTRFDPMNAAGKARNKSALQKTLGLPVRSDVPLCCVLDGGDGEGGLELLAKCATQLLRNDVQLVVQLPENGERVTIFRELADRWPDRVQVTTDMSDGMIHRVVAGSDLMIAPVRHAPTGFLPMRAHRYGTLPIARRVGGLADAVVDCDAQLKTGSGFLFDRDEPDELLAAIQRGLGAFAAGDAFDVLRTRVMRIDHSWERSARLYDRLYHSLTETD